MKKLLILVFLLAGFSVINSQTWKLVWSDEFETPGLSDAQKWGNEVGFIRNNELQYYTSRRLQNSIVDGGKLLIIGRKESYESANYTSASLTTDGKFSWKYGKIEARMKLPVGQGMWPAFWMLGQNIHQVDWPACGEIDIMEHINNENLLHGTVHWLNGKHVSSGSTTPCDVTKYHDYSIIWDENAIKLLLDGEQYWEVNIKDNANNTQAFHLPQYIILNLAIGGDWPKNPDASSVFPDTVFVDYVRVYQDVNK
jgi:beta-glucanase (GH16 family)